MSTLNDGRFDLKSTQVDQSGESIHDMAKRMVHTMHLREGVGLAAPQVHYYIDFSLWYVAIV